MALAAQNRNGYTKCMKRLVFLLSLLCACALSGAAAPYSHDESVAELGENKFLTAKLLYGDEITYCISLPDGETERLTSGHLAALVRAALREWTHGIALHIRTAGRAVEMQDILAVLEKPLRLTRLPACRLSEHPTFASIYPHAQSGAQQADLTVIVSSSYCGSLRTEVNSFFATQYKNAQPFMCVLRAYENPLRTVKKDEFFPGVFDDNDRRLLAGAQEVFRNAQTAAYDSGLQKTLWQTDRLFYYDTPTYFSIISHELGHAFGLGDEYLTPRPAQYASQTPGDGLMRFGYRPIGCDETDGLITRLDRAAGINRRFASFCPGRGMIENGTEIPLSVQEAKKDLSRQLAAAAKP